MSVQCGMWNFDQRPIEQSDVTAARATICAHGAEPAIEYSERGIQLFYVPFRVVPESESETQPFRSSAGQLLLWDGRLDNRQELIGLLRSELRERPKRCGNRGRRTGAWGIAALSRLIGDWALSAWNAEDRTVLLAKDFLGAKSLYYKLGPNGLSWSSASTRFCNRTSFGTPVKQERRISISFSSVQNPQR